MSTQEVTQESFPATISGEGIVLLDFWAAWCRPCVTFRPIYERAAQRHPEVVFGTVDTEAQQTLAGIMGITSIPTLIGFRDGIMVYRKAGPTTARTLGTLIESIQALDMDKLRARLAEEGAQG